MNTELQLPKIENLEELLKAWRMVIKQAQVLPTKIKVVE